jgi:hypothetical protein
VLSTRGSTLARKLPAGIHARLARGFARAARLAAEAGKCDTAEVLLGFGGVDLRAATGGGRRKVRTAVKVLDAVSDSAAAMSAVIDCRARARAQTHGTGGTE